MYCESVNKPVLNLPQQQLDKRQQQRQQLKLVKLHLCRRQLNQPQEKELLQPLPKHRHLITLVVQQSAFDE